MTVPVVDFSEEVSLWIGNRQAIYDLIIYDLFVLFYKAYLHSFFFDPLVAFLVWLRANNRETHLRYLVSIH